MDISNDYTVALIPLPYLGMLTEQRNGKLSDKT